MNLNQKEQFDYKKIPEDMQWLENRTILLTMTGSYAYGTNTENSDIDYKGVCIPPEEYYFGLKRFNDYNTTGGKTWKNMKDDIDISIMHLNKFVLDAMSGVPNNIEILFVNPEHIISCNTFGQELINIRYAFLSKALKHKFGGYAHGQIEMLKNKKCNGTGRQDLVKLYGYDTKFGSHAVRLLTSGIELLKTGNFSTYRPNREELIAIRNGKYTLEQLLKIIDDLDKEMNELYDISTAIPHSPDYNKINNWLININKRALYDGRSWNG